MLLQSRTVLIVSPAVSIDGYMIAAIALGCLAYLGIDAITID